MIEIINQFGEAWFKYFGLSLVQNTLFLAAVFVMLYLLRNAAAQSVPLQPRKKQTRKQRSAGRNFRQS